MNVNKNINASFSVRTMENGVTLRVPDEDGRTKEFVFEKTDDSDTTYLARAEAAFQQSITDTRNNITDIKAEFEAAFDKYSNDNNEEESVE